MPWRMQYTIVGCISSFLLLPLPVEVVSQICSLCLAAVPRCLALLALVSAFLVALLLSVACVGEGGGEFVVAFRVLHALYSISIPLHLH